MARKTKAINDRLTWRKSFNKYKLLYLMLIPGVLWYVLFKYAPMFGIVIAFEKYQPFSGLKGMFNSKWVGLYWFRRFFKSIYAWRLIRNSLLISLKKLVVCFPSSILLAILLNAIPGKIYKKSIQTVSYLPHFLSHRGGMQHCAHRYQRGRRPDQHDHQGLWRRADLLYRPQ